MYTIYYVFRFRNHAIQHEHKIYLLHTQKVTQWSFDLQQSFKNT